MENKPQMLFMMKVLICRYMSKALRKRNEMRTKTVRRGFVEISIRFLDFYNILMEILQNIYISYI